MSIRYEQDYIVGGRATDAITPNFTVREFSDGRGIHVHRELVGALQELRDAVAVPVRIAGLAPRGGQGVGKRGQFAFVSCAAPERLHEAAARLVTQGFLATVADAGPALYVDIPDPANPRPLAADDALARAVRVTAAYETSGDPYLQVTGNFDGAGLSFGPLQVNFRSGTLPQLFQRFAQADAAALAACFTRSADWNEWQQVLSWRPARQLAWADQHSRGPRKADVAAPWKGYLQAVGRVEAFRAAMLQYAYDVYGRKLIVALAWLQGLWPGRIDNFACLAALYDLCVQQGSLDKAHAAIRARVAREEPTTQQALVHIAVEERGRRASEAWRADCISRRLGILYREPVTVTEAGRTATRDNLRNYLVRNVPVKGAERYLA